MKVIRSIELDEPRPRLALAKEAPVGCTKCEPVDELDDELRGSLLWQLGVGYRGSERIEVTVDGATLETQNLSMLVHGLGGWVVSYHRNDDGLRHVCDCGANRAEMVKLDGYVVVTVDGNPWPWDDPEAQAEIILEQIHDGQAAINAGERRGKPVTR